MSKKVSIITINYNGAADTCELVQSLRTHEIYPYEVIVVDNGSKDINQYLLLKEKLYDAQVIRSDENLGFAGGNNLGLQYATGDYLFFLNNDTIIVSPILERLVKQLDNNPTIGCISPKIASWPETKVLQYAGSTAMSPITLRNENIGFRQIDQDQYNESHETAFVHGAAMIVRTSDIQKFGVMPEFYFLYYEELDWCEQMRKAGFNIWYESSITVFHKESVSVGIQSPLQIYYHTRNRFIFAKRTITQRSERYGSYLYQSCIAFPKKLVCFIVQRKFNLIRPLCNGLISGLKIINKNEYK